MLRYKGNNPNHLIQEIEAQHNFEEKKNFFFQQLKQLEPKKKERKISKYHSTTVMHLAHTT